MKKILYLTLFLLIGLSCKAQPIIPVENLINYHINEIEIPDNVYFKDTNGLFDQYTGIWEATRDNKTYEFHVVKITRVSTARDLFKIDELEIRYKITNATTGAVIVNTTALTDSPYIIRGWWFNEAATYYTLSYIGYKDDCGQNGTVFIEVPPTNNYTTMKLFLLAHGETTRDDCAPGEGDQILPTNTNAITLDKQ